MVKMLCLRENFRSMIIEDCLKKSKSIQIEGKIFYSSLEDLRIFSFIKHVP